MKTSVNIGIEETLLLTFTFTFSTMGSFRKYKDERYEWYITGKEILYKKINEKIACTNAKILGIYYFPFEVNIDPTLTNFEEGRATTGPFPMYTYHINRVCVMRSDSQTNKQADRQTGPNAIPNATKHGPPKNMMDVYGVSIEVNKMKLFHPIVVNNILLLCSEIFENWIKNCTLI